ncbi:nucleotide disphospho-sugar-binding domain-containing protein [Mesorhizobium sp. B2-4-15]|uniref:glycosyltransferase n=1 Tax=Mesorhizobium sp. B2-4-15 TaxID=2589934 RepID=UPI001FEF0555|nr:nucleotide disphospho-sugar-binding domain-containing protein [Mesorhizobium sp. B2-4-15]
MTRKASPTIALFPESSFGAALNCVGIAQSLRARGARFCEALRFGAPSLIIPYCWDGHDNAQRAGETGVGDHIGRDGWTEGVLERAILGLLADDAMRARLRDNAARMALEPGTDVAAQAILSLIRN